MTSHNHEREGNEMSIERSKPFMDDYLPEQEEPANGGVPFHRPAGWLAEYVDEEFDGPEDDGQPSEYDEWQDYMGGDDWDHGQYDSCDW